MTIRRLAARTGVAAALAAAGAAVATWTGAAPAGAAGPASPVTCAEPLATWTASALAAQVVVVLGSFTATAALAPAARQGVGALDFLGQPPPGSGSAVAGRIASLRATAATAGQVVPWMSSTQEGGTVTRLRTVIGPMPSARQLAASPASAIQATATSEGSAMRALGLTMNLAPVLDTAPPTDTIAAENTRSFSDTGAVAGADGLAFARGMLAGGIVPVVKHFPGLGHANANSDTGPATVPPLATLEKNDLIPFEQAVRAGMPAVMVGNQIVPGLTAGTPASLSPATYAFLRHTLGFGGVTVTDALGAGAVTAVGDDQAQAAVAAVGAGADLAMISAATWTPVHAALQQAITTGQLPMATVQTAVRHILVAKGVPVCRTVGMAAGPQGRGYWIADAGGGVAAYGSAGPLGSMEGTHLNQPIVGTASAPDGGGYWEVASDGGIFTFGTAGFDGSMGGHHLNQPIVGMASTPDGGGYWEVAADGGIFTFGNAGFDGSMGGHHLNQPIVGMASTPDGGGYWEVAADGGIFTFGNAGFDGSMGGSHLNAPIVGMAATPTGGGYWEVAADGGIFTFGNAGFDGSMGGSHLNAPIVGMAATPTGGGYWEVAADGGIFTFGNARFYGSSA